MRRFLNPKSILKLVAVAGVLAFVPLGIAVMAKELFPQRDARGLARVQERDGPTPARTTGIPGNSVEPSRVGTRERVEAVRYANAFERLRVVDWRRRSEAKC